MLTIIKAGVVLILLTPLVMGSFGINISEYPKAIYFRSLTEIVFILYLVLIAFKLKYIFKISPLLIAVFIFIAVLTLASFTGINFQRSFFGDLRRAEGVILQIHLLLFLLVCLGIFKEENDWLKLFKITLLVSGVSSILAVLQKLSLWQPFGYDFSGRPVGTFSNPDFFGPYLVLAIFLGLFILMQEKRQKFKIFWLLVLILDVFALILTQMRVAWIGLGAGFIFIFCWLAFNYKNYKTQIKKIIVIPIVIFVIFLIFTISNNDFLNKLGKIFSWPTRLVAWDIAWNSFLQRPILGWGPESFLFVYNKFFKAEYLFSAQDIFFDRVHDKFLEIMSGAGLLGILSYLAILFIVFYFIFKNKKENNFILAGFLIVYLVQNIFIFDTLGTYLIFFLFLGYIDFENKGLEIKKPVFGLLLIPFLLLALWFVNARPTQISMTVVEAVQNEKTDLDKSLGLYLTASNQNTIYQDEFKEEILEKLLIAFQGDKNRIRQDKILKSIIDFKSYLEARLEKKYGFCRNLYTGLIIIDENTAAFDDMERTAQKAIEFNDQIPDYYQFMGAAKILKGESEQGEEYFTKALQFTPQNIYDIYRYHYLLGITYLKAGNNEKAKYHLDLAQRYKQ